VKYPTSQTTASFQSRREHVRRVILKSPELTNRDVAERTGAAQSTVSEVRRELRVQQQQQKQSADTNARGGR
jgi:IS30 family transposase